jgi:pyruvate formate lyase activating enzyme
MAGTDQGPCTRKGTLKGPFVRFGGLDLPKDPDQATILEIQKMSTEDGPGIRTTVFFKGCTLKCAWCHNPESISPQPQIRWLENRCLHCAACCEACLENILHLQPEGLDIDRGACRACGRCVEECPSGALEMMGRAWAVDELLAEILKDRAYYSGGGGITLGGGEPTFQPGFAALLLKRAKEEGLHTALDTCGLCAADSLALLLPHTDLLLYDLKEIDPRKHRRFTGQDNERILANLLDISRWMAREDHPGELWIRTPIIPGATATLENIAGIGAFISKSLNRAVSRWDLCAFNNLCRDKYLRLGLEWEFKGAELLTREFMEEIAETARRSGVDPAIVHWSGATRL